jgi:hypothetical protein
MSQAVKKQQAKAAENKSGKKPNNTVSAAGKAVPVKAAAASKPRSKPERKRYVAYVPEGLQYALDADSKEARASMNETLQGRLVEANLKFAGHCTGSGPSQAAAKKCKAATSMQSNIVILREVKQFKIYFAYVCQRVRTRELEFSTDSEGDRTAIDKNTGAQVPPITRRVKSPSGEMTTLLMWSQFENKTLSLGRIKLERRPKALPSGGKAEDDEASASDSSSESD